MKLTPDTTIRAAYRTARTDLARSRSRGVAPETLAELEARVDFLRRIYDLG